MTIDRYRELMKKLIDARRSGDAEQIRQATAEMNKEMTPVCGGCRRPHAPCYTCADAKLLRSFRILAL